MEIVPLVLVPSGRGGNMLKEVTLKPFRALSPEMAR